jgi:hypothetical protein
VVKYDQYFSGEHSGTGLGKQELLLQVAECSIQRSKKSKILNAIIARMVGANKISTCELYLEGQEVFGS